VSELQTGTVIGEYVTEGILARTGLSTLYRASHPVIGKRAVVKVPTREQHARTQERFVREARAVNLIRHPNVVDIFGFGTLEDGRSYLTMEHLEGETLAARLHRFRFSHTEAHEVLLQLSDVIDAAHAVGVLHLDLKPDNIFLVPVHGARILVKVLDFGIAAVLDEPESFATGGFRGTPEYASPEQAQAHTEIGPASDVYSMGCIAFEMLVGKKPFSGETVMATLLKQIGEQPAKPSTLSPTITKHEDALVLDMLQKRPDDRPKPFEIRERLLVLRTSSLRASTQTMMPIGRAT
jgi:serine/threonine protein kinase